MKKSAALIITLALCLFSAIPGAFAAGNAFKEITSFTAGEQFRVALTFDAAPKPIVKYYEKSIQVDLPGSLVKPAKRVFGVNHAGIKEINLYQINPSLMRIRIFPQDTVASLKKEFSLEMSGEKMVFAIGPKAAPLSEPLTPAAAEASKIPAPVMAEVAIDAPSVAEADVAAAASAETHEVAVPASAESAEDAALIASLQQTLNDLKTESAASSATAGGEVQQASMLGNSAPAALPQAPSLGEAFMKIGSALAVVLALILVISFAAKKYFGAMEGGFGAKKQLKVLSNHFIGVKKNVTIIEVGGEILVLGVTNNSINLLARYNEPEKIEEIKFAHRLPDKPMGVFKKLPFMAWLERRAAAKRPLNPAFARQVASYQETMNTTAPAASGALADEDGNGIQTRKDEMVNNVARSIADRLRTLQGRAG